MTFPFGNWRQPRQSDEIIEQQRFGQFVRDREVAWAAGSPSWCYRTMFVRRSLAREQRRIVPLPRESATLPPANEQLAERYLEIARLFVAYGRSGVARRRLKLVIDQCADCQAALESRALLAALDGEPTCDRSSAAA